MRPANADALLAVYRSDQAALDLRIVIRSGARRLIGLTEKAFRAFAHSIGTCSRWPLAAPRAGT